MSTENKKEQTLGNTLGNANFDNLGANILRLVEDCLCGIPQIDIKNVDISPNGCEIRKVDLTSGITKFMIDESTLIAHIQNRLNALMPRAANSSEDDAYRIREMCSNYLPETIRKYLEIDTDQRDDVNSSGMTNRETFMEQLHEMESALAIYASRLLDENQSLVTNGTFLANILPPKTQLASQRAGLTERMKQPTSLPSLIIGKERITPGSKFMREDLEVARHAYVMFLKSPSGQGYIGTTGTNEEHIIAVVPKSDDERPLCRFEKRRHKIITRAIAYPMITTINVVLIHFWNQWAGSGFDERMFYIVSMVFVSCMVWLVGLEISNTVHECTGLDSKKACDLAWRVATSQTGTKTGDPRTNEQAKIMALPVYRKAISEYDSMLTKDISSSVEQAQHLISSDLAAVVF